MSQIPLLPASQVEAFIARFWGKAQDGGAVPWHPLAYHQADVAACAVAIAETRPWMLKWIADQLGRDHGWDPDSVRRLIAIFAFAHDVGKYAIGFQAQVKEAFLACTGLTPPTFVPARGALRHDALGLLAWTQGRAGAPSLAEAILGEELDEDELVAWTPIAAAAFGHHGHPTDGEQGARSFFPEVMRRDDLIAACTACARLREIVGSFPRHLDEVSARRVSIPLAGLIQAADWMGSDLRRGAYIAPQTSLQTYWEDALRTARRSVADRGLLPTRPAPWAGPAPLVAPHPPTPMQTAAATVALKGPFLAILEDTMGSGKTEASLILAWRAMAAGLAHGIFIGMPTTATADGQAERQANLRRLLFKIDERIPSFTVAHGRSAPERWPTEPDGAPLPSSWIADERRLRLLADLCVGTVDQALLSVMATEFAAVRRFGLLGKILVIDEVHAYDAYTLRLVEDLVREHAAVGGSVVLLSATLTATAKQKLLTAFQGGRAACEIDLTRAADPTAPYPALTVFDPEDMNAVKVIPVAKAPTAPPDKQVKLVQTPEEAEVALLAAVQDGCAAWIRLTVDDCIASAVALAGRHHNVMALHSRMPQGQRQFIEAGLLKRFGKGKEGEPITRQGGLVVATSVIAASLDLDFDLVVVDLRGMDELLQALGRGRRHRRAADGRLLAPDRPDGRAKAPMLILAPDPTTVTNADWLRDLVGWGGAKVAGNAARAWRTAVLLRQTQGQGVRYGTERGLIEDAASAVAMPTPAVLAEEDDQAEVAALCRRNLARTAQKGAQSADTGYIFNEYASEDDEYVMTRIDDIETIEILLVEQQDGVVPLGGRNCLWSAGRIRLPKRRFVLEGLHRAKELAKTARLPRGSLAVPVRREKALWVHTGELVKKFTIDPQWGLRWD